MTPNQKRPLAQAWAYAEAFRGLFPCACYQRWEIAGSIRRGRPEVGDVEHVVVPRFGEIAGAGGLFGEPINLVWHHLDAMVARPLPVGACAGEVARATYPDGRGRWGELYRGALFRAMIHEIFTATPDNFGAILAIRTGPAEFSRALVMRLAERGLKQAGGKVLYARGASIGQMIPVPTEEKYFQLAGLPWIPSEQRDGHELGRMYLKSEP